MIKKISIGIGILLLLLLASAVLIPVLFKDKIIAKVKTEINDNINAKVDFGDFSISILRSFPNLSFSLEKLSVVGINEFAGDTLTSLKSMDITVDIMSVIKGDKIRVRKVVLDRPSVYAMVLKDGKTNWDISKPSPAASTKSGEGSQFKLALKKLEVKEGKIVYEDRQGNMSMEIFNLENTTSGDFTQDLFVLETRTTADALSFTYGGVKYLSRVKTDIRADLEADMPKFRFTFKDNEAKINDLALGFDGFFAMPGKDMEMDIRFNVKKSEFRSFISLIPAIYSKDFSDLKTSGKLAFDGFVKGIYNDKQLPAFNFNLQVSDGMFRYPKLPTAVNHVQVDLKVTNPDGVKDHTVINLAKMHVEVGKEPFDARLLVKTPISDPDVDAALKGTINLGNIQQLVPLEKGTSLAGIITSDFSAQGRMSQVKAQKYEDFKASGQISGTGINYVSADFPKGVQISQTQLTFNPKNVTLNSFDGKMGESDFHMNGMLENFIAFALKKETLKGTLNFTSSNLNVTELMGGNKKPAATQPAKKDSTPMSVVEVPANIDFTLTTRISTMKYDNMVMNNVAGSLIVKDQEIKMSGLGMQMLDGTVTVNGLYGTKNVKSPDINFDLSVDNCDIQKTAATFASVKKMAPIAERCAGRYTTKFSVTGKLDSKMAPMLNSFEGGGKLSTKQVVISNFEPINKVADALKMEKYKKLELNNINATFKFHQGRVSVDPFDVKIGNANAKISGSNGFDQTIDYVMAFEIPRAEFGGAVNNAVNGILSQINAHGANLSIGDKINVDALITGTVAKPSVKLAMKGTSGSNAGDDLKAKAKEELDKKKAELEAKAREEADKAKQQAEAKIKEQTDKARAEADRVKKEAEDKAKAEAEKAKKEAEQKAKDKLKSLFPKQ